ncbi:MAG: hypothetical protein ACLGGX_04560 [Bdellovibrionia bacterium]
MAIFLKALVMFLVPTVVLATDLKLDFSVADQHGKEQTIPQDTKLVIFAADMDGYKLAREAFEENKIEDLSAKKVFFISDISKMPALISKMFAIPKMKELKFQIFLDKDGTLTKDFPREEKKLTLLKLTEGKVTEKNFTDKKEELIKAL